MSLVELTPEGAAAGQRLVASGRLRIVPPDAQRAAQFLGLADARLDELRTMRSPIVRHGVAYDVAHDVGEAFLAAYGFSTVNGPGQHAAIGEFLAAVIESPPAARRAARGFEQARRTRNQQNYRATDVGEAQALTVERVANDLRAAAEFRGVGR